MLLFLFALLFPLPLHSAVNVLSTTALVRDLVCQIGGKRIESVLLIEGEVDPHTYELAKGDSDKLLAADLIIANGLGLEHGASLRAFLDRHPRVLFLAEEIERLAPDRVLMVEHQRDPHIWMDISLWQLGISPIVEALSDLDPENAEFFSSNGETLRAELIATDLDLRQQLSSISQEKRFLVTSHEAFRYFTRRYLSEETQPWEERCAAPEGLAPESQLSIADIERVIDYIERWQVKVVFPESNVSKASLQKIVTSCKYRVSICDEHLYADALGEGHSYLQMMRHNLSVLLRAWQ